MRFSVLNPSLRTANPSPPMQHSLVCKPIIADMLLFFKMGTVVVAKDYGSVTIAHTHKGKCAAHARRPFTAKQLRDAKHSFMCRKVWSAISGKSCLHEKHSKRRVSVSAGIAAGYQMPGMVSIFPAKLRSTPRKALLYKAFRGVLRSCKRAKARHF